MRPFISPVLQTTLHSFAEHNILRKDTQRFSVPEQVLGLISARFKHTQTNFIHIFSFQFCGRVNITVQRNIDAGMAENLTQAFQFKILFHALGGKRMA